MVRLKHGYCDSFVSVRALCLQLGVEQGRLRAMAARAQGMYRIKPLRTGDKVRELHVPHPDLAWLQKRLVRRLLNHIPWPDYLQGAIKGRSAITNAAKHAGARVVAKVDVRDFFPSITRRHVYRSWVDLGFSPGIARLLTQLTTYGGTLPQGAPTSAALANLVLLRVERPIVLQAIAAGCQYTRFIDDIAISGRNPHALLQPLVRALQSAGFRVNHRKTRVISKHHAQSLTGYTLNSGRPSRSLKNRRHIAHRISELRKSDASARTHHVEVRSIRGSLAHLSQSNPASAAKLSASLNRILQA